MRILHHGPVDYLQPSNNSDIILNTISSTSTTAETINSTQTTGLSNFSSDFENSNVHSERTDLFDQDANVTITTTNRNDYSVKFLRNQNYRIDAKTTNNLNQLNSLKSVGATTDLTRTTTTNLSSNGNNENATRQIFEDNNIEIRQRIFTPAGSNVLEKNSRNCTEFKVESSVTSEDEEADAEDEEDDDDEEEEEEEDEDNDSEDEEYEDNIKLDNKGDSLKHLHQDTTATTIIAAGDGATSNLNRKQDDQEERNISIALARKKFVKLDLDRSLQSLQQQKQHSNQRENHNQHCYQKNSFSSSDSDETSPDDSLMEDEDAFSETPSSCASLDSPEPTHYPRGIINPNYPGFQHLAHTLSEHFVNHHLDQDDSDLSEFEVELSVESLDENFACFHSNDNLDNNNCLNNNNLSDDIVKSAQPIEDSGCLTDQANYNLGTIDTKASREHKELRLPEIRISSSSFGSSENDLKSTFDSKPQNIDSEATPISRLFTNSDDMSCDLDTYLKKFATSTDSKTLSGPTENEVDSSRDCPTPDILIKNDKTSDRKKTNILTAENRPDLLRNVSTNSERLCDEEKKKSRAAVPDNIEIETKRSDKDEISYGITPVDIVGDFGREVEHEFGLIVSGYNTSLICRSSERGICDGISAALDKMSDAVLSDGKEKILTSSEANLDVIASQQIASTPCDLVKTSSLSLSPIADHQKQTMVSLSSANPDQQIDHSSVKLTIKNSKISSNDDATTAHIAANSSSEKLIPTAIVKPKYQKSSYDDRQLPPIGLAYYDQTKTTIHHQQQFATSPVDQRSRKIHQQFVAHLDRNAKYSKKLIGRASSIIARDKFLTNSRRYDKATRVGDGSSAVAIVTPRKKDKMENYSARGSSEKRMSPSSGQSVVHEKNNNANLKFFKSSSNNNKKEHHLPSSAASFDVYNIETALPVIDLEAIENHLRKAKEEERKRRNDREEIRRRLAMGAEDDYFSKIVSVDRPGRKPSLQSRLQSGMNLQICFMNEASSDTESPSSDSETCPKLSKSTSNSSNMSRYSSSSFNSATSAHPYNSRPLSINIANNNNNNNKNHNSSNNNNNINSLTINKKFHNQTNRPSTLSLGPPINAEDTAESDFFTKQARLQIEARMALAQAKDMAHMQMEIERQKQKQSPITEVIRNSLEKVGVVFPPEKRRVSRQMLTDMNIAQLQIIVNELHTQIERLNEQLVQYLMERDDLHMGQDSMLVDIEDLTRYLGAKEQSKLNEKSTSSVNFTKSITSTAETTCDYTTATTKTDQPITTTVNGGVQSQNKFLRIANLVKK